MEGNLKKPWDYAAERVRAVSQIPEDQLGLAASYGPNGKEQFFQHTVRGVIVQITRQTQVDSRNVSYRLCIFPGWSLQWVNEGNIRSRKIVKTAGEEIYERIAKAA